MFFNDTATTEIYTLSIHDALPITVPVTIDGSGFVSGATVSAGAGITVSNVAFVSSARLTASFPIASAATAGPRVVTVTKQNGTGGSLSGGITVSLPVPATLALVTH